MDPVASVSPSPQPGDSTVLTLPRDPNLVVLGSEAFPIAGDGLADDTAALQRALDATPNAVVFLPEGAYRVTSTLRIPKGIRLIGFGSKRPELVVAPATAAFAGPAPGYVVEFAPQKGKKGNDTFYTGLDNVNLRIGPDNPAAVGVKYDVAQGCILQNVDFHLSPGNTGISHTGSEIHNCRFFGGDYAIKGGTVAWQMLVTDCVFSGQRQAAFATKFAGLTLFRCSFSDLPVAFLTENNDRAGERIFAKDCLFEGISDTVLLTQEADRAHNQFTLLSAQFHNTPTLVRTYANRTTRVSDAPSYAVEHFLYGLEIRGPEPGEGSPQGQFVSRAAGLRVLEGLESLPDSDFPALPPVARWINAKNHGVIGDGKADDTAALQAVIDAHDVVYLPLGNYRISDTLTLRAGSALIGLHPRATQIRMSGGAPGYEDIDSPRAMVATDPGGPAVFNGIGLSAGNNPGAVSLLWRGDESSFVNDVWFSWSGKGTKGSSQNCGLWVDGGGGIFKNLWLPNDLAPLAMRVTDTSVPGSVYMASLEHHSAGELVMRNVRGWSLHALQTENGVPAEHVETGRHTLPVRLENCHDLVFSNLYLYSTSSSKGPRPRAVSMENCSNLRFYGVHNWQYGPNRATLTLDSKNPTLAIPDGSFTYVELP